MAEEEPWAYIGPVSMGPQGRVTIPKRWRELLDLKPGDVIHIKISRKTGVQSRARRRSKWVKK